jgi:hypothetical protein
LGFIERIQDITNLSSSNIGLIPSRTLLSKKKLEPAVSNPFNDEALVRGLFCETEAMFSWPSPKRRKWNDPHNRYHVMSWDESFGLHAARVCATGLERSEKPGHPWVRTRINFYFPISGLQFSTNTQPNPRPNATYHSKNDVEGSHHN